MATRVAEDDFQTTKLNIADTEIRRFCRWFAVANVSAVAFLAFLAILGLWFSQQSSDAVKQEDATGVYARTTLPPVISLKVRTDAGDVYRTYNIEALEFDSAEQKGRIFLSRNHSLILRPENATLVDGHGLAIETYQSHGSPETASARRLRGVQNQAEEQTTSISILSDFHKRRVDRLRRKADRLANLFAREWQNGATDFRSNQRNEEIETDPTKSERGVDIFNLGMFDEGIIPLGLRATKRDNEKILIGGLLSRLSNSLFNRFNRESNEQFVTTFDASDRRQFSQNENDGSLIHDRSPNLYIPITYAVRAKVEPTASSYTPASMYGDSYTVISGEPFGAAYLGGYEPGYIHSTQTKDVEKTPQLKLVPISTQQVNFPTIKTDATTIEADSYAAIEADSYGAVIRPIPSTLSSTTSVNTKNVINTSKKDISLIGPATRHPVPIHIYTRSPQSWTSNFTAVENNSTIEIPMGGASQIQTWNRSKELLHTEPRISLPTIQSQLPPTSISGPVKVQRYKTIQSPAVGPSLHHHAIPVDPYNPQPVVGSVESSNPFVLPEASPWNFVDPIDDTADPIDDTADPIDDTADPIDDTADPIDDTADPIDDTADVWDQVWSSSLVSATNDTEAVDRERQWQFHDDGGGDSADERDWLNIIKSLKGQSGMHSS